MNPLLTHYTGSMRQIARSFSLAGHLTLAAYFLGCLSGCSSAYVQATLRNVGPSELHNIEVDYPSASFGVSSLAPGATFQYRFQIQDAGWTQATFFDSAEHRHIDKGPYLAEGQRGTLDVRLDGNGTAQWKPELHPTVAAPAASSTDEHAPLD